MASRLKSSVVIAKLLDSEGFNDRVQNMVERYWLHTVASSGRKKHRRLERNIAEMCKKFDDGEKLILGKFISMHKAMSFQTGLRIGLTAFACKHCKEYEVHDAREEETAKGDGREGTQTPLVQERTGSVPDGDRAASRRKRAEANQERKTKSDVSQPAGSIPHSVKEYN